MEQRRGLELHVLVFELLQTLSFYTCHPTFQKSPISASESMPPTAGARTLTWHLPRIPQYPGYKQGPRALFLVLGSFARNLRPWKRGKAQLGDLVNKGSQ